MNPGTRVPGEPLKGKTRWTRRGTGNRTPMMADAVAVAARRQRRVDAFNLRVSGLSLHEIGRRLGISKKQADRDIDRAIEELGVEDSKKKRAVYSATLERAILDERMAIQALRGMATAEPPDLDASRTMAAHNRTIGRLVAELAHINGVKVPEVSRHEHTGANGGPIALNLDDVLAAVTAATENLDAVRTPTNGSSANGSSNGAVH